jgi:hypothetical protein
MTHLRIAAVLFTLLLAARSATPPLDIQPGLMYDHGRRGNP